SNDGTPGSTIAANVSLGLRYVILLRDGTGQFREVDAAAAFHAGDRVRIRVQASAQGYLYIVHQARGKWSLLYPMADTSSNQIRAGESRDIPASGQFVFDEHAGTEKIFIVLSRRPELDLHTPTIRDQVISELRDSEPAGDVVSENDPS